MGAEGRNSDQGKEMTCIDCGKKLPKKKTSPFKRCRKCDKKVRYARTLKWNEDNRKYKNEMMREYYDLCKQVGL